VNTPRREEKTRDGQTAHPLFLPSEKGLVVCLPGSLLRAPAALARLRPHAAVMLGALVAAVRDSLRALMRLLTHGRAERERGAGGNGNGAGGEGQPASAGASDAGAAAPAGDGGWALPYEDPLVFPSATLKSAESRCDARRAMRAPAASAAFCVVAHARTRAGASARAARAPLLLRLLARGARASGAPAAATATTAEMTPLRCTWIKRGVMF
jgi:hypothetical protein